VLGDVVVGVLRFWRRHLHKVVDSTHIPPCEQWLTMAGAGAALMVVRVIRFRRRHLHKAVVSTRVPPYEQWLAMAGVGAESMLLFSSCWGGEW
jgi:hypothetical protein